MDFYYPIRPINIKPKNMLKTLIGAIVLVGIMYVIIELRYNQDVIVEQVETVEVIPFEQEEEDAIEKAKQELQRINAELDAKEQELLLDRDAIDAELERVREARLSFQ